MQSSSIFVKQSSIIFHKPKTIFTKKHLRKKIYSSLDKEDIYNIKLQEKYKIQNMLTFYDKVLAYKFDVASNICDKKICISKQPECYNVWKELERIALLKKSVEQHLHDLNDWLSENNK